VPAAIPNGGGGSDVTTAQLAAYSAAKSKSAGDQTAQEQATVAAVEAAVQTVAQGWQDSGGPGGDQAAAAIEVAERLGRLEAKRVQVINQHAEKASGGTQESRRAQAEMHGADTEFFHEVLRELIELRQRLNRSPY
jgi:hypothetical protein